MPRQLLRPRPPRPFFSRRRASASPCFTRRTSASVVKATHASTGGKGTHSCASAPRSRCDQGGRPHGRTTKKLRTVGGVHSSRKSCEPWAAFIHRGGVSQKLIALYVHLFFQPLHGIPRYQIAKDGWGTLALSCTGGVRAGVGFCSQLLTHLVRIVVTRNCTAGVCVCVCVRVCLLLSRLINLVEDIPVMLINTAVRVCGLWVCLQKCAPGGLFANKRCNKLARPIRSYR